MKGIGIREQKPFGSRSASACDERIALAAHAGAQLSCIQHFYSGERLGNGPRSVGRAVIHHANSMTNSLLPNQGIQAAPNAVLLISSRYNHLDSHWWRVNRHESWFIIGP